MNIAILAVGSELLTPDRIDTDSLYLTRRLNDLGLDVGRKAVVGDERAALRAAVAEMHAWADLLFVIGGLGPTEDDRTREAVAEALGRRLVLERGLLLALEERFRRRGKIMTEPNRRQAFLVEGAEVLRNRYGSAPGQWIEDGGRTIVLLPGPPREVEGVAEDTVWPRLETRRAGASFRLVLKTAGLAESEAEPLIADLYPDEPGLRLTTLAAPGQIEYHVFACGETDPGAAARRAAGLADRLKARLGRYVISDNGDELEAVVGNLLRVRGVTLGVAESVSGGLVSSRITDVPGSSAYFLGAVVAYDNRVKTRALGVPEDLLAAHGAVSEPVARAMAEGARATLDADYGLSTTGVAGPGGGSPDKPVGLVYAGLAWGGGSEVSRSVFLGGRAEIKRQAAQKALDMLRLRLLASEPAEEKDAA